VNDLLLILVLGAVIVGVLFVLRSRDPDQSSVSGQQKAQAPVSRLLSQPIDPMVVSVVVGLLGRSRKFQAIKELRRATGLGLADARALIDAIQSGHRPPSTVIPGEAVDVSTPDASSKPAAAGLAERARNLRATGREVEAIRLVCDETGMGILDAQNFVRSLN
jgi:ribosomal protein L7/L12